MSDDYHDDDSRSGGLWDPDAHIPPPPTHARPTLRVITSNRRQNPAGADTLAASADETLVPLDQFRPADLHETHLGRRIRRSRLATITAAALIGIVAITVAIAKFSADGEHQPPRTQANTLSTDAEQAALVRKVAPHPTAIARRHRSHRRNSDTKSREGKNSSNKPRTATPTTTQVRSAPSPPPHQPSTSTVANKPTRKLRQYDAVSSDTTTPELHQPVAASEEFGFEP
jgi:hypothetical protein